MNEKSKPSLYRGDYYTIEEYEALINFLGADLLSHIIRRYLPKGASAVKRRIHSLGIVIGVAYDLIYNTPLDNVPLFLNEDSKLYTTICQWRFQINK